MAKTLKKVDVVTVGVGFLGGLVLAECAKAGLTGVGGPVLSGRFMSGMGFSPLYSIAIGQPLQVVAGTSGSVANILSGSIDYVMATWVTLLELFGFYMGIIAAYRMKSQWLRKIISCLCILTSLYLFIR